jgi:ferredoxin
MKKVYVDETKCIGCGACVAINPENFDFNDDGLSTVINETPNKKTIEAKETCPVYAIEIEDNETCDDGECCCHCCDCSNCSEE